MIINQDDYDALLALSDERDRWMTRLLDEWRAGYRCGHADATADAERRESDAWASRSPLRGAVGPSHAEMDKRRYPPDGRLSWLGDAS